MSVFHIAALCMLIIFILSIRHKPADNNKIQIKQGNGNYDVTLVSVDNRTKIYIVKMLKMYAGYDLKESKNIVENLPFTFMKGIEPDYAENIKRDLEQNGAVVEIKKVGGND